MVIRILIVLLFPLMSIGQQITLVIDPGHGGDDPGHLSKNAAHLAEKDLNLKIAKFFGNYIEKYLQHVKVVYTRTDDTFPSLDKRVDMANNTNADYFISIHCNGNEREGVHGTETHVHSMGLNKSVKLARNIEKQFSSRAGRKSRGVKDEQDLQHSLQVLKYTHMTSVLVECGFVTNENEAAFLNSAYGQEILASAIFRAFRQTIEDEHPTIAFRKSSTSSSTTTALASTTNDSEQFGIQIASSKDPINTDDSYFKRSKLVVERKQLNTTSAYKYIYVAGKFTSKSEAEAALEEVRKRGFKDAFVIKI